MQWYWDKIEVREPLIQQNCVRQQKCCVDHNFLNLESSLPKWQSTSDVVRRLAHLGFFRKRKNLMNLLKLEIRLC